MYVMCMYVHIFCVKVELTHPYNKKERGYLKCVSITKLSNCFFANIFDCVRD